MKSLLSQVINLRATNWDSGASEGLPGTYVAYSTDDAYGFADYGLGMVC